MEATNENWAVATDARDVTYGRHITSDARIVQFTVRLNETAKHLVNV